MKILLVIDSLGSGGAQRQITSLACGLKKRGHQVEIFNYYPNHNFYRPIIEKTKIKIIDVFGKKRGFSPKVLYQLILTLRKGKYDLALSFLNSPSFYLELSHFLSPLTIKVVSERNSILDFRWRGFLRHFHRLSSCIVVNSQSHYESLWQAYPFLRNRLNVIYNGVDIDAFTKQPFPKKGKSTLKLLGIGRISPQKNLLQLIHSLHFFYKQNQWVPEFNWVGRWDHSCATQGAYWKSIEELIDSMPEEVRKRINFLGEQRGIQKLLADSDALILASHYEGLPNVVCEALACGRPILASNVSDNRVLVKDGYRGFLFDPNKPDSISESISSLMKLKLEQRNLMSKRCREYAEQYLSNDIMIEAYESLFEDLKKTLTLN